MKALRFSAALLLSAGLAVGRGAAADFPPYPQSRAPFELGPEGRHPVKMVTEAFTWRETNLLEGVRFECGDKSLWVSGFNRTFDCNRPIRFGRIFIAHGREQVGMLIFKIPGEGVPDAPGDRLEVNRAAGTAIWARNYTLPDGSAAMFAYRLSGTDDGKVLVDFVTEAKPPHVGVWFVPANRESRGCEVTDGKIVYGTKDASPTYEIALPESAAKSAEWHKILTMRLSETRGRIVIDLLKTRVALAESCPPVGGIDFWAANALHVPKPVTRNLLQNGSFEQDFKGWRWEDWGTQYTKAEKPREEIVGGGRHALLLRGSQPRAPALCSAPMPLEKGRRYTFSCFAKSISGKATDFRMDVRSVSRGGKYFLFKGAKDFPSRRADGEWRRFSVGFTADAGGFFVRFAPSVYGADEGVLIDCAQVEQGDVPTEFAEAPYVANLVSSDPCNDLKPGDDYRLALDVQAFGPRRSGTVRVRILNFYSETRFDRSFGLDGDGRCELDVDPANLGKGVFVVRMDYSCGGVDWTDYARFSVLEPLDGKNPTSSFYANGWWFLNSSQAERYARKFVEWGWTRGQGKKLADTVDCDAAGFVRSLGIRNAMHPVSYEGDIVTAAGEAVLPTNRVERKHFMRDWTEAKPEYLQIFETAAYQAAMRCLPEDDVWTFWNEEESWARRIGFAEHVKFIEAVQRGVRKAFAERGLPPPRFAESDGTSHYFAGRNYDAMEGYLKAANDRGFKYDVIAVHPYSNIDGGTLGPHDADAETAHLIGQMKEAGYPDSTPIYYTECFNMSPYRIPQWGADGWNDSYRRNTQPSQDRGNREFVQAGSLARLYLICLKYWPKVQLVHPWLPDPIMDIRFSPLSFILAANTIQHLLPDPRYYADEQPYADVRGYVFRQGDEGVMAVWTTNHDVEWGVKRSPVIGMKLPPDTRVVDLEGNPRTCAARVPLTPAPLFFISKDVEGLRTALREAVAEDPSTALSLNVLPDADGAVLLTVRNETKVRQRGTLGLDGRELAYDVEPRGEQRIALARGVRDPMRMQTWSGKFSILPNRWSLGYFFVPKCGETPDWASIPAQPITNRMVAAVGKKAVEWTDPGYRASYKAAWNEKAFLVRIEVEDPDYVSWRESGREFVPTALYGCDGCAEIYFDGFADARTQGTKGYDLNDSRYDVCEENVHRMRAVNWQLAQGTASATDEEIRQKLKRTFTRTEKGFVSEVTFDARYMAPIDLKAGTVAGFGVALHDFRYPQGTGRKTPAAHALFSTATETGKDLNEKPYLLPLMVLGE